MWGWGMWRLTKDLQLAAIHLGILSISWPLDTADSVMAVMNVWWGGTHTEWRHSWSAVYFMRLWVSVSQIPSDFIYLRWLYKQSSSCYVYVTLSLLQRHNCLVNSQHADMYCASHSSDQRERLHQSARAEQRQQSTSGPAPKQREYSLFSAVIGAVGPLAAAWWTLLAKSRTPVFLTVAHLRPRSLQAFFFPGPEYAFGGGDHAQQ